MQFYFLPLYASRMRAWPDALKRIINDQCYSSVIGCACTKTWEAALACRILLGLGMGVKAVVGMSLQIYDLEKATFCVDRGHFFSSGVCRRNITCSHPRLDYIDLLMGILLIYITSGSMVMNWQRFVAFGIFLYLSHLFF